MFNLLTGYNEDLAFNYEWDVLILPFDINGRATASTTTFMLKHYPVLRKYENCQPIKLLINNRMRTIVPVILNHNRDGLGLVVLNQLIDIIRKLELKGNIILPCIRHDYNYPDIDNWVYSLKEEFGNDDINVNLYFSNHFHHFSDEVLQYCEVVVIPIVMNYYAVLRREGIIGYRQKSHVRASYDSDILYKRGKNNDALQKFQSVRNDKVSKGLAAEYS